MLSGEGLLNTASLPLGPNTRSVTRPTLLRLYVAFKLAMPIANPGKLANEVAGAKVPPLVASEVELMFCLKYTSKEPVTVINESNCAANVIVASVKNTSKECLISKLCLYLLEV